MVIDGIAETVLESFEESETILTIVDKEGCYVSSKTDVFERIFADPRVLDSLCKKIDDGCEPLVSHIGSYFVAGSAVKNVGYSILIVPNYSPDKNASYHDFAEIILSQVSLLTEKVLTDSDTNLEYYSEMLSAAAH